jgi:hypothetical protein
MATDIGQDQVTGDTWLYYVCPVCQYQERDDTWFVDVAEVRVFAALPPAEVERRLAGLGDWARRRMEMRLG